MVFLYPIDSGINIAALPDAVFATPSADMKEAP